MRLVDDAPGLPLQELLSHVRSLECQVHGGFHPEEVTNGPRWQVADTSSYSVRLTLEAQFELDHLLADVRPLTTLADDPPPARVRGGFRDIPALYDWQREALAAWTDHGRRGVVEAVTGTGKTRVGIEAVWDSVRSGVPAVIAVPGLELQEQWIRALKSFGIGGIATVGGGIDESNGPWDLLIGTVQSLAKRDVLRGHRGPALLVADECHRYGAPSFQEALDDRYTHRLGLTATFERSDEGIDDLIAFFGSEPVYRIDYGRALRDRIVSQFHVLSVGVDFDSREAAEYQEHDAVCRRARRTLINAGLPVEPFGEFIAAVVVLSEDTSDPLCWTAREYLKAFSARAELLSMTGAKQVALTKLAPLISQREGAILFTRHVASAEQSAEALRLQGVAALAISGESPAKERKAALEALRRGAIKALVAPQILDEGIDVPDVDLGVIVATTRSKRQMIQRMGRVIRLKKNDRSALFVILYVRGTSEDPFGPDRAHEAFLDMILQHALGVDDVKIDVGAALSALVARYATSQP